MKKNSKIWKPNNQLQNISKNCHYVPPPPLEEVKKEEFKRQQFFSKNKQYVKIKLMKNETNLWSIFW